MTYFDLFANTLSCAVVCIVYLLTNQLAKGLLFFYLLTNMTSNHYWSLRRYITLLYYTLPCVRSNLYPVLYWTLSCVHRTLYPVLYCILPCLHCTLFPELYCILPCVHCTLYPVPYGILLCTLHTLPCNVVHTPLSTLHTVLYCTPTVSPGWANVPWNNPYSVAKRMGALAR